MRLKVTRTYPQGDAAVRRRILELPHRLRAKYRTTTEWVDERTLRLGGPGLRGRVALASGALHVDLELSSVLTPMRRRIEKELDRELDRVVGTVA